MLPCGLSVKRALMRPEFLPSGDPLHAGRFLPNAAPADTVGGVGRKSDFFLAESLEG